MDCVDVDGIAPLVRKTASRGSVCLLCGAGLSRFELAPSRGDHTDPKVQHLCKTLLLVS